MLLKETTVHAYLLIRFVLSVQSIMGEYNYGGNFFVGLSKYHNLSV